MHTKTTYEKYENLPARSFNEMERGTVYEGYPYFPHLAYREYLRELREADTEAPSLYVSMAITSGGYRRDASLSIEEVVARNTAYGRHLRDFFSEQGIAPNIVVIPSELAAMRNAQWGQLDFLMFWFHIMAAVSEHEARYIEDSLRKQGIYQDAKWAQKKLLSGTREETWQTYAQFTDNYAEIVKTMHTTPMRGVIGALDAEESLGGSAEKRLARLLQIPYYTMNVQENILHPEFKKELDVLTELGAKAINTFSEQGPQIILQSVDF